MDETLEQSDPHIGAASHVEVRLDPETVATRAFYFTMGLVVVSIALCVLLPLLMAA